MASYLTEEDEKKNPYLSILQPFKLGKEEHTIYGVSFMLVTKSGLIRSMFEEKLVDVSLMPTYDDTVACPHNKCFLYVWYAINGFPVDATLLWENLSMLEKLKTWTYFNYFDVPLDSVEMKELKAFVSNTATLYPPETMSASDRRSAYEEFKKIIFSAGKKFLQDKPTMTILTNLSGKEFSPEHIACAKIFGSMFSIPGGSWDGKSAYELVPSKNFSGVYIDESESSDLFFVSPTLRLCSANLSMIFTFLRENELTHLLTPAVMDELLAEKSIHPDVGAYIRDQVIQGPKERCVYIKSSDERTIVTEDSLNDNHYRFLHFGCKSLVHLLAYVQTNSGYPGLLDSTSPYSVSFRVSHRQSANCSF